MQVARAGGSAPGRVTDFARAVAWLRERSQAKIASGQEGKAHGSSRSSGSGQEGCQDEETEPNKGAEDIAAIFGEFTPVE
eukprot:4798364-Lingulodinium_polyedra.AAC.1